MRTRAWASGAAAAALLLACASTPPTILPGTATAWGQLRLVPGPHAGGHAGGDAAYGSRRLRDTKRVDYSTPGPALVYMDAGTEPAGQLELSIQASRFRTSLEPEHGAVGVGGRIEVRNRTSEPQVVTCPQASVFERLAPGGALKFSAAQAGTYSIHVLGRTGVVATVFAAPGPYTAVSESGDWVLRGLAPGHVILRTWHPRLPSSSKEVHLTPDALHRVDFELSPKGGGVSGGYGAPASEGSP